MLTDIAVEEAAIYAFMKIGDLTSTGCSGGDQ
jgi:hypothetical protein